MFKRNLLAAIIATALSTSALAGNGILQNEYIKAGVNELTGTLGSGGNTSPGLLYNNAGTSTWNTSYDYLTPGSPFEGFTVRIEDSAGTLIRTYTNNNAGNMRNVTGAWVGTPSASSAVWSGSTSDFNLQHTYSLPSGQKYIDIDTRIDALVAMPKLWFGRFIDPDAVAAAGDSSATDNVLGYGAIPRTNVVFSEATVSRYALGLYSAAPNVKAGITGWSTDPKAYYANGTAGYGSYTANTYGRGDDTIGLGFYMSNVAVGDIVNFKYAYIFGPSAFGAATTAIAGGAGGGTAGTVPGGGTLVDVGSATSAATSSSSSTPTVTGTSAGTPLVSSTSVNGTPVVTTTTATPIDTRSGFNYSQQTVETVTTTTPVTTTTTTTPRTITTYSDGSTTTASGTPVVTTATTNNVSVTTTTTTVTEAVETSLPVITASLAHHTPSETKTTQTIARETTTNVTTPITRTTNVVVATDGTTTSDTSSSTLLNNVDTSVVNESFSGRIDQMSYLTNLNKQLDRGLNMDAFRTDGFTDGEKNITMYINASGSKSSMGDGYNANSQIYGLGIEKGIKANWRLGAQYNRVTTSMDGSDSKTTQDKNHVGLFSVYTTENDTKIVNNLGYADNSIKGNRTVENVFNNSHATKGDNLWLNNRIYAPETKGFRPYAGVTIGRTTVGGYTEAGSIQSARTVDKNTENYTYGEAGIRYEKAINDFRLIGDIGTTTDSVTTGAATIAYAPTKTGTIALTAATQHGNNINTNTVSLRGIIRF
jgi:hypothetical protein